MYCTIGFSVALWGTSSALASATSFQGRMKRYDELLTQALRVAYAIAPNSVAAQDTGVARAAGASAEQPPGDEETVLFGRLILNVPYITPNAIDILNQYCTDEVRAVPSRHQNSSYLLSFHITDDLFSIATIRQTIQ